MNPLALYPTLQKQLTLTQGQRNAVDKMADFILDPDDLYLIVEGYAGTGKSTSLVELLRMLPRLSKHTQLIDPTKDELDYYITATTNPAAEALGFETNHDTSTIHSLLGIVPKKQGYKSTLVFKNSGNKTLKAGAVIENALIIIDEIGTATEELWDMICTATKNCKFILLGDPNQLIDFNDTHSYVFTLGFDTVVIDENIRSGVNTPITNFGTCFRQTVQTGVWAKPYIDGVDIVRLNRSDWETKIIEHYGTNTVGSKKVLAWTNDAGVSMNNNINKYFKGRTEFAVGDNAIVNTHFSTKEGVYKSNQRVHITSAGRYENFRDVDCRFYTVNGEPEVRVPVNPIQWMQLKQSLQQKLKTLPQSSVEELREFRSLNAKLRDLQTAVLDLRSDHAQTVNKSQGSTYKTVFIDFDDIFRCKNFNMLARLCYVAGSRPSTQMYITGGPDELFG